MNTIKNIVKLSLITLSLFISSITLGANRTFTWDAITECSDGSAVGSANCPPPVRYRLQCSTSDGPPYETADFFEAPANPIYVQDFAPGEYWCVLAADNGGGFSGWSNEVNFTVAAGPVIISKLRSPVLSVE